MFRTRTLHALAATPHREGAFSALVGFDGFVDSIVTPVDVRAGQGEAFTPIRTIREFGERIVAAAGKSTNIELHLRTEKLGGNGPIMANALLAAGVSVTYVGALGRPQVHPVFADLAARARTFSLCAPAHTTAVEFTDGKVMLGTMRSLDDVTFERIGTIMGVEANAAQFYPDASRAEASVHEGLYRRRDGQIDLSSIRGSGFGYRIEEIDRVLPSAAGSFGSLEPAAKSAERSRTRPQSERCS